MSISFMGPETGPQFASDLQTTLVARASGGSSTPTFTRATTAYQTDFEDKQNLVLSGEARFQGARRVRNLLTFTEDQSNAAWTSGTPSSSATATVITFTGAGNDFRYQGISGGKVDGGVYVASIEVMAGTKAQVTFEMPDLLNAPKIQVAPTGSWQKVTFSGTSTGTGTHRFGIENRVTQGGDGVAGTVVVRNAQVELVTGQANQNPSEYVSVGVLSAPYHGAGVDGVKYFNTLNGNTVASNVVTEATGVAIVSGAAGVSATAPVDASGPYGYLAEGARTNRCLQSQEFDEAVWVSGGGGVAVDDQSHAAPDGTTTADTLTASGANGTLIQDLGVVGSAAKTLSIYLKRKTGTGNIDLTMDGGSTWETVAVTTSWARFTKTQTVADEDVGIRIVTSGDEVYAWGAQVETASFASSYIPTTTVAVPRNASVGQYVSAGNINANALSLTMHVTPSVDLGSTTVFHWASYVDASNYTAVLSDGTNLIARKRIGGANHDATIAWTRTAGTVVKVGARFDTSNGIDVFLNGAQGTPDTTTTTSQIGTNFQVGADGNSANQDFCEHRLFAAYPKALSAGKLQAMTS